MNKRILVVDDEATIRMSLVEALTAEGYEVEDAETGEDALARCHADDFDLLVTDLKLPGISGLEVLTALRNQNRTLPVILMTAYGEVDTAVAAMREGAYDYINKPFKQEELLFAVDRALHFAAMRKDFKQAHKLFTIQPLSKATEQFTATYIRRMALTVDNDPQVVAERSGLNLDEVKRFLQRENDQEL